MGTCAGTRLGRRELLGEKLGFAVCKPKEGCALQVGTSVGTLECQDGTAEETRNGCRVGRRVGDLVGKTVVGTVVDSSSTVAFRISQMPVSILLLRWVTRITMTTNNKPNNNQLPSIQLHAWSKLRLCLFRNDHFRPRSNPHLYSPPGWHGLPALMKSRFVSKTAAPSFPTLLESMPSRLPSMVGFGSIGRQAKEL